MNIDEPEIITSLITTKNILTGKIREKSRDRNLRTQHTAVKSSNIKI